MVDKLVYIEDQDFESYSTCTECNCMTWNEEERVCHNCNFKLLPPQRSFHEDKIKYLRTHLLRKNTWCVGRGGTYEHYMKHHSLTSSAIKQIKFIFKSLLNFIFILGYTKVTQNYLYTFKLMYAHLGINKQLDQPRISKTKRRFHDDLWLNFLPYLNHVFDDKHKREDERRNIINVINRDTASEIIRQQEWESGYWFD